MGLAEQHRYHRHGEDHSGEEGRRWWHRSGGRRWSVAAALLVLTGASLWAGSAAAQQARIRLDVDKHIVNIGEPITITVELSVEGRAGADYVDPPMPGLQQLSGGLSSQNIEVINWQVTRRETHVYTAMAQREGQVSVGPAMVHAGGKTFRSNVVKIEVRAGGQPAASAGATAGSQEVAGQDGMQLPAGGTLPSVFIGLRARPRKVYVGQQVNAEWKLYTQSDVLGFRMDQQPATDGFWSEDLSVPRRLRFEREVVNGRVYYSALLLRKALFAQRVGQLTIGAVQAEVQTMDTFGAATQRASEAVPIEVVPLPVKGRPAGFSEANVGHYDLAATLDRDVVKVGDAVTLRITARGTGNLRQLELPPLGEIKGLKVYEPKVEDVLDPQADVARGEKRVEYLLLPTSSGKLSIPSVTLHYFDPDTGRYGEAKTAPLTLTVSGSLMAVSEPQSAAPGASNVLGPDIRPPRPARALTNRLPPRPVGPVQLILLAIPFVVLLVGSAVERLRAARQRPTERSRERAATRRVREYLRQARSQAAGGDARRAFDLVAAAIREQLGHHLGCRVEGLTRDELQQELQQRGIDATLREQLITELDNCDMARYAPGALTGQNIVAVCDRAQQLVRRVAGLPKVADRSPQERGR